MFSGLLSRETGKVVRWRALLTGFFLLGMSLLSLMIWAAALALDWPHDGLTWSSRAHELKDVEWGGPGDGAGLRPGDRLVALDGVPIEEVTSFYASKGPGDRVTFTVLRDGQRWNTRVTLAAPSWPVLARRLAPLLVGLGFWLIGAVVLARKPAGREARFFFLLNQVATGALTLGLLSTFIPAWAARLFPPLLLLLAALVAHFHLVFPERKALPRPRLWPGALYGIAVALSLPYLLFNQPQLKTGPWYGLLYTGGRLYVAFSLLLAAASLGHTYATTPSPKTRQQIRLVAGGTFFAFAPLTFLALLPDALGMASPIPYEMAFLFLLLIPLAYAYAIRRHRLLALDRFLNRSLVYLALSAILAALYLAISALLSFLLPQPVLREPLLVTVVALVVAFTFNPLRDRLQMLADRLFYGGWYDYRAVVGRFSQALSATLEEAALAELLVERLTATLRVRGAALLLPAEDGTLTRRASRGLEETALGSIRGDGALARFLRREERPVEVSRLRRAMAGNALSTTEAALLAHEEIQVWLPLVFRGELEGILLLGSKLADALYGDEDYRILATLAWQAATTARNVRLMGELRQRLEEIAQSQRELAQAHRRLLAGREEERKRLAREVHDGPVQDLIGLSYRLRDYGRQAQGSALAEPLRALREESLRLLGELRRMCTELRPPALDVLGLASTIRSHAEEEGMKAGLSIALELMDDKGKLPEEVAISLFRIYQEALANAVKHAEAKGVVVRLALSPEACGLSIRDDGRGFMVPPRLEELAQEGHFGLLGMQERAEALGGRLAVVSVLGEGTEIRVWVPVSVKREA